jgi:hypothetical protein
MKIHVKINREYIFNLEPEIKRLKKNFKGKQLKRQMDIINAFSRGDLDEVSSLYRALPDDEHCSEKEYVGLWLRSWLEASRHYLSGLASEHVVCIKNDVELKKA